MPVAERPDVLTLDNFIGGRWVKARATDCVEVRNPAVGDLMYGHSAGLVDPVPALQGDVAFGLGRPRRAKRGDGDDG